MALSHVCSISNANAVALTCLLGRCSFLLIKDTAIAVSHAVLSLAT